MKTKTIRIIYLYLFSLVGLIMLVIGSARLVDLGLRTWVFTEADKDYYAPAPFPYPEANLNTEAEEIVKPKIDYATRQRHRDLSSILAQIIIGLPLYLYHWGLVKKENQASKDEGDNDEDKKEV